MGRSCKILRAFVILPFFVFLLHGVAAFGDDSPSSVIEGIQKNYGYLHGLTISYTRDVVTRSMSMLGNQVKGDLATGRIYFKPPHFLRLEQETPKSETIITNGDTIWWYIPEKRSVHKYSSNKFGRELRLLSDIFCGLTHAEDKFQIAMVPLGKQGEIQLKLSPNPPWQEIDHIVLTVNDKYIILVIEILNQLGGMTRFRFEHQNKKGTFEKDFFQFIVPEGVRLVEEEG